MIKIDGKLFSGKRFEELDERFFRMDMNDEIQLTPFAEDKIAKAMKDFYSKKLKDLSIAADNWSYVSRSTDKKEMTDNEATDKLREQYKDEYKDLNKEYEEMQLKYKEEHPDEFEWVETIDPATTYDEETDSWKSDGGNLYEFSCSSLQEAAIGYQTASAFLKTNTDTSSFPTIKKYQAKDRDNWSNELKKMQEELLKKYPDVPRDVFNPTVTKTDYKYTINWRATQKLAEDDSMLTDAANEYVRTLLAK